MLGLLVVTHGRFAENLVSAASAIVGDTQAIEAVSIDWNDDVASATERIRSAIGRVDRERGVLVLTDMFGGTPTNLALALHEPGKIEIVTGVNLPMVVKALSQRAAADLEQTAERVAGGGRESIQVASRLLDQRRPPRGGANP